MPGPSVTPSQVIAAQVTINGCPDQTALAVSADFQTDFAVAVAGELAVDPARVVVTNVDFEADGKGPITFQYVVKDVDDDEATRVHAVLEDKRTAVNIGERMSAGPCPAAQVGPAISGVMTVEITQEPVIVAQQPVGGVSLEQAQQDDFKDAFAAGVGGKLGMNPASIEITGVSEGEDGAIVVAYQVNDVDTLSLIATQKALESEGMGNVIAAKLQDGKQLLCTTPAGSPRVPPSSLSLAL